MRLRDVAVIDRIEFGAAIVFRAGTLIALGGIERGRGGDDGDAGMAEGFAQRLERGARVMRPAVGRLVADRLIIIARPRHVGDRRIVIRSEAERSIRSCGHVLRSHMRAIILQ
jgi:hypothetical protein